MATKKKSGQAANDNELAPSPAPTVVADPPSAMGPAASQEGAASGLPPDAALAGLFGDGRSEVLGLGARSDGVISSKMLEEMTPVALYALRQDIDSRLPPRSLNDVDLVEELMLQYQIAKALMASVLSNFGTPANQKAQVQNSCVAVLEQVSRTQTAIYNAERVKSIEIALEKAFGTTLQKEKEAFYARYELLVREEVQRKREKKAN